MKLPLRITVKHLPDGKHFMSVVQILGDPPTLIYSSRTVTTHEQALEDAQTIKDNAHHAEIIDIG